MVKYLWLDGEISCSRSGVIVIVIFETTQQVVLLFLGLVEEPKINNGLDRISMQVR